MENTIGQTLRKIRYEHGDTITKVSAVTHITPASLSSWETGRVIPTRTSLERLAAYYKVDLVTLLDPAKAKAKQMSLRQKIQPGDTETTPIALEDVFDQEQVLTFAGQPVTPAGKGLMIAFLSGIVSQTLSEPV